ncbi:ClpX C4-type zinc finger protein [Arthrobacter sp. TB 26]|uniref:ClpX C4-type zinc finger protein n=1 Tax=Arthrobacter sp. TB 26 TaxID=494420 RepID=UPI00192A90AB|nr:ClpX C4-type zinc finger protein [Arthrobacter sp. TB 26]
MEPELPLAGPLMCSFCAGPAGTSRRMVAGPGVAICQACAAAAVELFHSADGAPAAAPWERITDDEVLAHLPEIATVASQVEERLSAWVGIARERKISWARIGSSLGMTRQSAWERFQRPH